LNKILKRFQTLDDIPSHQISPLDKSYLGYAGDPSNKNDANPNSVGNNTERGGESILSSQIFLFQIQMIYATLVN